MSSLLHSLTLIILVTQNAFSGPGGGFGSRGPVTAEEAKQRYEKADARVHFEQWSDEEAIRIPGTSASTGILKRSTTAVVNRPEVNRRRRYPIDLVYSPDMNALWLGHAYDEYLAFDGRILAIRGTTSCSLHLRWSENGHKPEDDALSDEQLRSLANELKHYPVYGDPAEIKLLGIFGLQRLRSSLLMQTVDRLTINGIEVRPETFVLRCVSQAGKKMELEIDDRLRVVGAKIDDQLWPVIDAGRAIEPRSLDGVWIAQRIRVRTQTGSKWVMTKSASIGDRRQEGGVRARIVFDPESRLFWTGPAIWEIFMTDKGVYGLKMTSGGTLEIYRSDGTIDREAYVPAALRKELGAFEEEILRHGRVVPDETLAIDERLSELTPSSEGGEYFPDLDVTVSERSIEAKIRGTKGKVSVCFAPDMTPKNLRFEGKRVDLEDR